MAGIEHDVAARRRIRASAASASRRGRWRAATRRPRRAARIAERAADEHRALRAQPLDRARRGASARGGGSVRSSTGTTATPVRGRGRQRHLAARSTIAANPARASSRADGMRPSQTPSATCDGADARGSRRAIDHAPARYGASSHARREAMRPSRFWNPPAPSAGVVRARPAPATSAATAATAPRRRPRTRAPRSASAPARSARRARSAAGRASAATAASGAQRARRRATARGTASRAAHPVGMSMK